MPGGGQEEAAQSRAAARPECLRGGRGPWAPAPAGRRRLLGPAALGAAWSGASGEVDPVRRSRAKPMFRFVLSARSSRACGTCYVSLSGESAGHTHWSRCLRHGLTPGKRQSNLSESPQQGAFRSLPRAFWCLAVGATAQVALASELAVS